MSTILTPTTCSSVMQYHVSHMLPCPISGFKQVMKPSCPQEKCALQEGWKVLLLFLCPSSYVLPLCLRQLWHVLVFAERIQLTNPEEKHLFGTLFCCCVSLPVSSRCPAAEGLDVQSCYGQSMRISTLLLLSFSKAEASRKPSAG